MSGPADIGPGDAPAPGAGRAAAAAHPAEAAPAPQRTTAPAPRRATGGADAAALAAFLATEFPQTRCTVVAAGERGATVRHAVGTAELRPGGTVSGPVLMAVADVALYVAIMGEIGIVPLVVSTSLTVNFMRKPSAAAAIVGVCRLLKVGRTLAVGEVWLYSEGEPEPVAHAVGTYAVPPARDGEAPAATAADGEPAGRPRAG